MPLLTQQIEKRMPFVSRLWTSREENDLEFQRYSTASAGPGPEEKETLYALTGIS